MRDPKRMKRLLKVIGEVWSQYPDLRLGQLLENITIQAGRPNNCLFYIEDGDLMLDLISFTGFDCQSLTKGKRKKKRKSKKIKGSGYKFPECLDPSLDDSGHTKR